VVAAVGGTYITTYGKEEDLLESSRLLQATQFALKPTADNIREKRTLALNTTNQSIKFQSVNQSINFHSTNQSINFHSTNRSNNFQSTNRTISKRMPSECADSHQNTVRTLGRSPRRAAELTWRGICVRWSSWKGTCSRPACFRTPAKAREGCVYVRSDVG
jgi:predicted O-linked N-acetylglucosamine transferase (SPINDLY family)